MCPNNHPTHAKTACLSCGVPRAAASGMDSVVPPTEPSPAANPSAAPVAEPLAAKLNSDDSRISEEVPPATKHRKAKQVIVTIRMLDT